MRVLRTVLARLAWLALAALALAAAGCSGGGPTAPRPAPHSASASATASPHHSRARLSARVLLPTRTMTAGSSMQGTVIVDNRTGHPVRAWGCLTLFQVVLFSDTYRPSPVWATCLQSFIIPIGESSYPVTVGASYLGCSEHGPGGGLLACLNGRPPPLPPGTYRTRFFQSTRIVPAQPAITVRVTAP